MWSDIATKLREGCKEIGVNAERDDSRVKDNRFDFSRKYKQTKDNLHLSGEESDAIQDCPHLQSLDEFIGSKDSIAPRHVKESSEIEGTSSAGAREETATLSDETGSSDENVPLAIARRKTYTRNEPQSLKAMMLPAGSDERFSKSIRKTNG